MVLQSLIFVKVEIVFKMREIFVYCTLVEKDKKSLNKEHL